MRREVPGVLPVECGYNAVGQQVSVTRGGRVTQYGYDANGNVATITDPLGRSVGFAYDGANRMTSQTLPDGRVVNYAYDNNGNVTSIIPPGRPAHRFTFTALDKEASYVPPAVGAGDPSTTYTYSLDRDLTSIVRPGGDRADYTYDTAGKLTGITTPTATYAYTYGVAGCASCGGGTKPDSVTRNGERLDYLYDGKFLLATTSSGTVAGSVAWSYDNEFRVIGQSVNGGAEIAYSYDTEGLLSSVGQLTLNRNNATGFLSGTTLGSVKTTYVYNTFGETTGYNAKVGTATKYDVSYTRDDAGRIVGKVETIDGVTTTYDYGYDQAGRLISVNENGTQVASYAYDSNGNRITADEQGTVSQGYYDLQDRLSKYGATTYSYTANGDLQSKTDASGTTSYAYDFYGNLTQVTLPDGTRIEYVIDAMDRRIGKKVNGALVKGWLYQDSLNPIAEVDGAGNVIARFVYGDRENIPSYVTKNGVTYRIVADHLGSPRVVIDTASNTVVQTYRHDAFGKETAFTDPNGLGRLIPFGFAGGLYDEQTGLTRFGARDYDPGIGRWTSKDPILFNGGDTNLYGYVLNDPVNWVDPKGLASVRNMTNHPLSASGNPGAGQGSGGQVPITIDPGETVNGFSPQDDVGDVDQVEGKKLPGTDVGPHYDIFEDENGDLTVVPSMLPPNLDPLQFPSLPPIPLDWFPDFPPDQMPEPKPDGDC